MFKKCYALVVRCAPHFERKTQNDLHWCVFCGGCDKSLCFHQDVMKNANKASAFCQGKTARNGHCLLWHSDEAAHYGELR